MAAAGDVAGAPLVGLADVDQLGAAGEELGRDLRGDLDLGVVGGVHGAKATGCDHGGMRRRVSRSIAAAACAGGLAACGGAGPTAATKPAASGPPDGVRAAVAVIRAWSRALARGDVAAASAYFAIPSQVQIAPQAPVVTVRTAADARGVNLALPCGAQLLDTRPVDRYIDALFRLGRRPGADCGTGVGGTARVAFVIRGGKIAVWRRIADEPGDSARAAPGFRAPAAPQPQPPPPGASVV